MCPLGGYPLIAQSLASVTQLFFGSLHISLGRVQIFMPEDLCQCHQDHSGIVFEELVGHRVPQQMWMQLDGHRLQKYLSHNASDALVSQWTTLPSKHSSELMGGRDSK